MKINKDGFIKRESVIALVIAILVVGGLGFLATKDGQIAATTENENVSSVIRAFVNEPFNINLDSGPTADYSWSLNFDQDYIEILDSKFIPGQKEGSIGVTETSFKGLKKGETELYFFLKAPEGLGAEDQLVTFKVVIS